MPKPGHISLSPGWVGWIGRLNLRELALGAWDEIVDTDTNLDLEGEIANKTMHFEWSRGLARF